MSFSGSLASAIMHPICWLEDKVVTSIYHSFFVVFPLAQQYNEC